MQGVVIYDLNRAMLIVQCSRRELAMQGNMLRMLIVVIVDSKRTMRIAMVEALGLAISYQKEVGQISRRPLVAAIVLKR